MHNDYNDDDPFGLDEPPRYDMLTINFMGDEYEITLPYCEVANGEITQVENNTVEIAVLREDKLEQVKMSYKDFAKVIETTFDTKEITQLSVQMAGSYDNIQIYES
jgi:hypothetical protein